MIILALHGESAVPRATSQGEVPAGKSSLAVVVGRSRADY